MSQERVAAGFVIFKRISEKVLYLMMQHSYGIHHWTPPKGHVDRGETDPLVTAYRETEEESGLLKSDLKVYSDSKYVLHYPVKGRPKTVIYWLAELINPEAQVKMSHEHQDYKWLTLEDACQHGNYDEMKALLKSCDQFIKNLK